MPRARVDAALVCDDVRIERSGKSIIIGVYVHDIQVIDFPAQLALTFWVRFDAPEIGDYKGQMRIKSADGAIFARGEFGFTAHENGIGAIGFERIPVHLHAEGPLKFEWQFDSGEWETVLSIPVKKRPPTTN